MTDPLLDASQDGCDCHVHIYELQRYPLAGTSTSGPPKATWNDYVAVQHKLGLSRVVLVQPTAYGYDNRCLLDTLHLAGGAARGIVVIRPDTSRQTLQDMHDAGVRGVRFMMIPGSGGLLAWDDLETVAQRIAEFGWVINLQLDGCELAAYEARLRALPCFLTIDHIGKFLEPVGIDHPGFRSLLNLLDAGRTWIKVSAPYETSKVGPPTYDDVGILARTLVEVNPDRCMWASNWPHPNRTPRPDDAAMLALLDEWAPRAGVREKVLSRTAAALYGFDASS
ncbi:amidohydrolase family protein [Paraburkholderia caffeinilytica]|uniref:amidohydrolase family protein n=1 Tax=Paraburkholderia caffeinilytica TaxID=1761016 RepID=UPI003DA00CC8